MTYDALRKGRVSLPGYAYVVTTVTASRMPYFADLKAARAVVREMRRLDQTGMIRSMAWVLMPDHLHWLLQLRDSTHGVGPARPDAKPSDVSLGTVIKLFKGRSAWAINRLLNRRGAVWQRAYYDRGVRENDDLREIAHYLAANPVRAGLVDDIGRYPHWDSIWVDDPCFRTTR